MDFFRGLENFQNVDFDLSSEVIWQLLKLFDNNITLFDHEWLLDGH